MKFLREWILGLFCPQNYLMERNTWQCIQWKRLTWKFCLRLSCFRFCPSTWFLPKTFDETVSTADLSLILWWRDRHASLIPAFQTLFFHTLLVLIQQILAYKERQKTQFNVVCCTVAFERRRHLHFILTFPFFVHINRKPFLFLWKAKYNSSS